MLAMRTDLVLYNTTNQTFVVLKNVFNHRNYAAGAVLAGGKLTFYGGVFRGSGYDSEPEESIAIDAVLSGKLTKFEVTKQINSNLTIFSDKFYAGLHYTNFV